MKIRFLKLIDVFTGKLACLILGYLDYLFNWTQKDTLMPPDPKKILVIRPGGMGDFLYLLPSLKKIKERFPQAKIDVLAEKRNRPVSQLTNVIDKTLTYDLKPFSTLARLWNTGYDLVIDSEQFHNFSGFFAYLTRAKVRIGFKTNPFRNHLLTHLIDYSLDGQEIAQFSKLLAPLGIREPSAIEKSVSREKILAATPPPGFSELREKNEKVILLAPRGNERYRRWNPEKYRTVIEHIFKKTNQAVVMVGAESERALIASILNGISAPPHRMISLIGKTSILQLAQIILESDLFIGCDSGLAVLGIMLGAQTITLFGSADENKWGLKDKRHIVIRSHIPCSPCQMLGSYKFCRNIDCMAKISAEDVLAAVQSLGF